MSIDNTSPVRIFALGGTGINIVSDLEPSRNEHTPGFPPFNACYLDTSRSNLKDKPISEEYKYLFKDKEGEELDGSGKTRGLNYEDINMNIKSILLQFEPAEFNIVVHSASGGSGSVIGPEIVSELKARGHQVIVILVGSTDTKIEIENTLKTVKSYESISHRRQSPVVMHYLENSKGVSRYENNSTVKNSISLLMGLFSGMNQELDTADLKNWLEFTNISGTDPNLASLVFIKNEAELEKVGTIISVATLAAHGHNTRIEKTPAYQCVGYVPEEWQTGNSAVPKLIQDEPIHYCISDDFITPVVQALNKVLGSLNMASKARTERPGILTANDKATDSGIVL